MSAPSKKLLCFLVILGFANIALAVDIVITETRGLAFPNEEAGHAGYIVVAATDGTAASFNITGDPNTSFSRSITESSIQMTNGGSSITVNNFTFAGNAYFDGSGNATVTVGATAQLSGGEIAGDYSGAATLHIVY